MKFKEKPGIKGVRIVSLGGFGQVTNNMFVYETERDILVVDCGIGFPTSEMLGVDLIIPDISYLLDPKRRNKIRGVILSHGHDDHLGGLPYVLPKLPKVPVFGSRWALALVKEKLKEFNLGGYLEEVKEGGKVVLGGFSLEFVEVTHSIPETLHIILTTPVGVFYHAADFKLDLTPVMGKPTNQNFIAQIGKRGILCLLSDCLRSERPGFTPSETKLAEMFEREIAGCQGKFFITTMSSNISRLKQAIEVSVRHQRKVVLVGRSIEKNVELALKMGYLNFPQNVFVEARDVDKNPPPSLTLIVAGSQAQAGSALERIVAGEHQVKIEAGDKVVFSTDSIPGNEVAIYTLIDEILRFGAEVAYTDILSDVHVSGHGQAEDLKKLIELTRPKYLVPIGGNFRHMVAYQKLAAKLGYRKENVLLPQKDQVMEFLPNNQVALRESVPTKTIMVDALGVGDVGKVVLRDRQVLASEGIVVLVIQVEQKSFELVTEPDILTRGFIYAKESDQLLREAREEITKVVKRQHVRESRFLRRDLQETMEKFFYQQTGRQPMVLSLVIEV